MLWAETVMDTSRDHLHSAREHAEAAAGRMHQAACDLVGSEVREHLRSAARHLLLAGVAALDAKLKPVAPAAEVAPVPAV